MSNVNDSIQAVCKLGEKFTEVVAQGANGLYKPKQIRKISKATAESITEIAQALRSSADVIKDKELRMLFERALYRATFNDILTEQNIGLILEKASTEIDENEICSSEEVQQDWITRFFNYAGAVSDEDMQMLWARVLSGEVKRPNSYSLRTLDTLRNLNKQEAVLLKSIAPYVLRKGKSKMIPADKKLLERFEIDYNDILSLEECGLLMAKEDMSAKLPIEANKIEVLAYNKDFVVLAKNKKTEEVIIKFTIYKFTQAGEELLDLINGETKEEYFIEVSNKIYKENAQIISVRLHKVENVFENKIEYDDKAIKIFEN